jgi:hypothetical protein
MPPPCPSCHSTNIVPIFWGFPSLDSLKKGGVFLGGCAIPPDPAKWHCNACELNFGARHAAPYRSEPDDEEEGEGEP